jgi:hypothetical protein
MLSLLLSFVLYGHTLNGFQTVGLALSLAAMIANFYEKGGKHKTPESKDRQEAIPQEKQLLLDENELVAEDLEEANVVEENIELMRGIERPSEVDLLSLDVESTKRPAPYSDRGTF